MKYFIAILSILASFSLARPAASHHAWQFPDVSTTHPNYTAIEYLRSRNLVAGYSNGTFRPYSDVTRALLVDMILKARNIIPNRNLYNNCFSDVKWQWYADEVCYAKSVGWLDSYGSQFKPSKKATLGEAHRLISRAFLNTNSPFNFENNSRIDRSEVAQLLYAAILGSGAPSQPATWVNPYTVNVPAGYPRPWVP